MSPRQIELARLALGLPNQYRKSYRNRFCGGREHGDYANWRALVNAGMAVRWPWWFSYGDLFMLTAAGASAVLKRGERLDPEDYASPYLAAGAAP